MFIEKKACVLDGKWFLLFSPVFLVVLYRSWRCLPVHSLSSPVVWPEKEEERVVEKNNTMKKKAKK